MAVDQAASLSILLVEPDDEARPLLAKNLTNRQYQVIVTLNEADAIARSKSYPAIRAEF